MDRLRRAALLIRLMEKLREKGSWCGETHVQKAVLFLQDLLRVPLGFQFTLYKHGPFSFDLRDELTSMRADELLRLEPQQPPYGPRIAATPRTERIKNLFRKTLSDYDASINFVAERLGAKGVADLEGLATALYVTQHSGGCWSLDQRSRQITEIKPHISYEDARSATEEVDCYIRQAKEILAHEPAA